MSFPSVGLLGRAPSWRGSPSADGFVHLAGGVAHLGSTPIPAAKPGSGTRFAILPAGLCPDEYQLWPVVAEPWDDPATSADEGLLDPGAVIEVLGCELRIASELAISGFSLDGSRLDIP